MDINELGQVLSWMRLVIESGVADDGVGGFLSVLLATVARGSPAFPAARLSHIPSSVSASDKNGN